MVAKSHIISKKLRGDTVEIDDIDKKLLNILFLNGREKLVNLAKRVGLSVDSTRKRLKRLENTGVIEKYTVDVIFRKIGYKFRVNACIKLKDVKEEKFNEFLRHLVDQRLVLLVYTSMGEYDVFTIFIGRNSEEVEETMLKIRSKYSDIIAEWKSILLLKNYKFNVLKL